MKRLLTCFCLFVCLPSCSGTEFRSESIDGGVNTSPGSNFGVGGSSLPAITVSNTTDSGTLNTTGGLTSLPQGGASGNTSATGGAATAATGGTLATVDAGNTCKQDLTVKGCGSSCGFSCTGTDKPEVDFAITCSPGTAGIDANNHIATIFCCACLP